MEQLELKIPTGVLNRVIMDAFEGHTPPVVGAAPLKLFYASMIGMTPPRILLFVNNPKYCADNYLAFLRNVVRNAFDLSGLPIEIELRERPKGPEHPQLSPGMPRKRGSRQAAAAPEKKSGKPAAGKSAPRKGASKKRGRK